MRSMAITVLSAALLFGCGDDDEGDDGNGGPGDAAVDSGTRIDSGVGLDSGRPDASTDASLDGGVRSASVTLASKSNSTVTGSATFTRVSGVVELNVTVRGASPGKHGIHIHQTGDCSAANASSAGAHWNPDMHTHGAGESTSTHLGDLGNITIAADGNGTLKISKAEWTLGDGAASDVVGHAIVVHANEDDLTTQDGDAGPGNSGGRQACGVIEAD
ncbi:MAG: superoxide dismutase family protein [Polyangiales bacterium]